MNPCLNCGQAPSLRTIDVTSISVACYLHCECGANTEWHFKASKCLEEWNKSNPAQPVELVQPVQTVQPIAKQPVKQQPSRAMKAPLQAKEAYGYA
jgi:hypothetical protein